METNSKTLRNVHPDKGHEPSRAVLRFLTGWRAVQEGVIQPGGTLVVDYDPERLSTCRRRFRELDIWNVTAYLRFHPSGQLHHESVLEAIRAGTVGGPTGPVVNHRPRLIEITVPMDAIRVELWFHTFSEWPTGGSCSAWDSRFGQNYWFDVARGSITAPRREQQTVTVI
jgi:hypothetical protein